MINLKLAFYSTEGKFEGFKELGKDFLFGGDFILTNIQFEKQMDSQQIDFDDNLREHLILESAVDTTDYSNKRNIDRFFRDEKDPLNRFNGRFDSRSYGNGRFILIKDDEDDFYQNTWKDSAGKEFFGYGFKGRISASCEGALHYVYEAPFSEKKIGNLHENPELFSKL